MTAKRGQPPKATAAQWARAALSAMAASGLQGVAIEALARTLNVTKGSFYGYYPNRDALIEAALALWESDQEEHMFVPLRQIEDPVRRFRVMAGSTLLRKRNDELETTPPPVASVSTVELSLMNDRADPMVARALHRVVAKRVDFLTECLSDIGHSPATARQMAVAAYTLSLGAEVLRRNSPSIAAEIDRTYSARTIAPYLNPSVDVAGPDPVEPPPESGLSAGPG